MQLLSSSHCQQGGTFQIFFTTLVSLRIWLCRTSCCVRNTLYHPASAVVNCLDVDTPSLFLCCYSLVWFIVHIQYVCELHELHELLYSFPVYTACDVCYVLYVWMSIFCIALFEFARMTVFITYFARSLYLHLLSIFLYYPNLFFMYLVSCICSLRHILIVSCLLPWCL